MRRDAIKVIFAIPGESHVNYCISVVVVVVIKVIVKVVVVVVVVVIVVAEVVVVVIEEEVVIVVYANQYFKSNKCLIFLFDLII